MADGCGGWHLNFSRHLEDWVDADFQWRLLCWRGAVMAARRPPLGVVALATFAATWPRLPPRPSMSRVNRVVLFSSGVGYFEHNGAVTGNVTADLRFETTQINDVLKSLVVYDRDGGSESAARLLIRQMIRSAGRCAALK